MLKAVYTIIGIDLRSKKDVLGLYISETEGANFWLSVLTDLQNRGVEDILISSVDGLKGFPEAINSIFPKTSSTALHNTPDKKQFKICSF